MGHMQVFPYVRFRLRNFIPISGDDIKNLYASQRIYGYQRAVYTKVSYPEQYKTNDPIYELLVCA